MIFRSTPVLLLLLSLVPAAMVPARAERLELTPPGTEVAIRFYGLGVVPLDGVFARFQGWLEHDPVRPGECQVRLTIDAHSLAMPNDSIRNQVVGPEYMDADRFPRMAYVGGCEGTGLNGTLELHGVRGPLQFVLDRDEGRVTATGRLLRANWGMTAGSFLGGQTVRIKVTIPRSNVVLRQASR